MLLKDACNLAMSVNSDTAGRGGLSSPTSDDVTRSGGEVIVCSPAASQPALVATPSSVGGLPATSVSGGGIRHSVSSASSTDNTGPHQWPSFSGASQWHPPTGAPQWIPPMGAPQWHPASGSSQWPTSSGAPQWPPSWGPQGYPSQGPSSWARSPYQAWHAGIGYGLGGQQLPLAPFPPQWAQTQPEMPFSFSSGRPGTDREACSAPPATSPRPSTPCPESLSASEEEDRQEEGSDDDDAPSHGFSPSVAMDYLKHYASDLVTEVAPAAPEALSFTEKLLGSSNADSSSGSLLKESAMVTSALDHVLAEVRGRAEAPVPGSAVNFRSPLPSGQFLKPGTFSRSLKGLLKHEKIPASRHSVSDDDLLLVPENMRKGNFPGIRIPDRFLSDQEELSRRVLASSSLLDSFMGGLIATLKDPLKDGFSLREDVDASAVATFMHSMNEALKASSSAVARLHVNSVLARRDGLLASSMASQASKKNLRAVPLDTQGSLFGSHVGPTLDKQVEQAKTSNFIRPRAPKRQAPVPRSGLPSGPTQAKRKPIKSSVRPWQARGKPTKGKSPSVRPSPRPSPQ